jgi:hypothetical protein
MSRSYLLYKRRKQRELLITTCNVVFRGGLKILLTVSYLAMELICENIDKRGLVSDHHGTKIC